MVWEIRTAPNKTKPLSRISGADIPSTAKDRLIFIGASSHWNERAI